KPAVAMIVGGVAGIVVPLFADLLEFRLTIDDPGGAISVHAAGGLWGLLAAGLFTDAGAPGRSGGQWLAQLVGMATLLGFVLPLSYGLNWLLDRVYPQRAQR